MAQITVTIRSDRGELGTHPKYGPLTPGAKLVIAEEDFGAELFERPAPDFLSPHEKTDRDRAAELGQKVGHQEPPPKQTAKGGKGKEVTDNA
jgi:hypothetical protein